MHTVLECSRERPKKPLMTVQDTISHEVQQYVKFHNFYNKQCKQICAQITSLLSTEAMFKLILW